MAVGLVLSAGSAASCFVFSPKPCQSNTSGPSSNESAAFVASLVVGLSSVDSGVASFLVWPQALLIGSKGAAVDVFRNYSLAGTSVTYRGDDYPYTAGPALRLKLSLNGTRFTSPSLASCNGTIGLSGGSSVAYLLPLSLFPTLSPALLTVPDGFTVAFWYRHVVSSGPSSGLVMAVTDVSSVPQAQMKSGQALRTVLDVVLACASSSSTGARWNKLMPKPRAGGSLAFAIYINSTTREVSWISGAGNGEKVSFVSRLRGASTTVNPTTLMAESSFPVVDLFDGYWHRVVFTVSPEPSGDATKALLQLYLDGQTFGGSVDYKKCIATTLVIPSVAPTAKASPPKTAMYTLGYLDRGSIEAYDAEVHLAVLSERNLIAIGSPGMMRYLAFSFSSSLLCAVFAFASSLFILYVSVREFYGSVDGATVVSTAAEDVAAGLEQEDVGTVDDGGGTLVSTEEAAGAVAGEVGKMVGTAKAVTRTLRNTASATSSRASKASSGGGPKKGQSSNANLSASITVPIRQFCLKVLPQILNMFQSMGLYFRMMTWPKTFSNVFKAICVAVAIDVSTIPIPIWLYPLLMLVAVLFLAMASNELAKSDDVLFSKIVTRYELAVACSVELLVDQLRGELSRRVGRTGLASVSRTSLRRAALFVLTYGRTRDAVVEGLRRLRREVGVSFPLAETADACIKSIQSSCIPREPLEALLALFLQRALIPPSDIPDLPQLATRLLTTKEASPCQIVEAQLARSLSTEQRRLFLGMVKDAAGWMDERLDAKKKRMTKDHRNAAADDIAESPDIFTFRTDVTDETPVAATSLFQLAGGEIPLPPPNGQAPSPRYQIELIPLYATRCPAQGEPKRRKKLRDPAPVALDGYLFSKVLKDCSNGACSGDKGKERKSLLIASNIVDDLLGQLEGDLVEPVYDHHAELLMRSLDRACEHPSLRLVHEHLFVVDALDEEESQRRTKLIQKQQQERLKRIEEEKKDDKDEDDKITHPVGSQKISLYTAGEVRCLKQCEILCADKGRVVVKASQPSYILQQQQKAIAAGIECAALAGNTASGIWDHAQQRPMSSSMRGPRSRPAQQQVPQESSGQQDMLWSNVAASHDGSVCLQETAKEEPSCPPEQEDRNDEDERGDGGLYVVHVNSLEWYRCPQHGHYLVPATDDGHLVVRMVNGVSPYRCCNRSSPLVKSQLVHDKCVEDKEEVLVTSKGSVQFLPCCGDKLMVCPCDSCCYTLCNDCKERLPSGGIAATAGLIYSLLTYMLSHSNTIQLVLFLILQALLFPICQNSLMIIACHPSVQCSFPLCYADPSTQFLLAVAVSGILMLFFRVGFALYTFRLLKARKERIEGLVAASHYMYEWFLEMDSTVFASMYQPYKFSFMAMEPVLQCVMQVCVSAVCALSTPDSMGELASVISTQGALGAYVAWVSPFADPWTDLSQHTGTVQQLLQLAWMSMFKLMSISDPNTTAMNYPMLGTVGVYCVVVVWITYMTVVAPWRASVRIIVTNHFMEQLALYEAVDATETSVAGMKKVHEEMVDYFGPAHIRTVASLARLRHRMLCMPAAEPEKELSDATTCVMNSLTKCLEVFAGSSAKALADPAGLNGRLMLDEEMLALRDLLLQRSDEQKKLREQLVALLAEIIPLSRGDASNAICSANALTLLVACHRVGPRGDMMLVVEDKDFSGLFLMHCDVRGAAFRRVDFSFSDVSHARMERAMFDSCTFTETKATGTTFGSVAKQPMPRVFSYHEQIPAIAAVAVTHDDAYLAVGTGSGDLVVLDVVRQLPVTLPSTPRSVAPERASAIAAVSFFPLGPCRVLSLLHDTSLVLTPIFDEIETRGAGSNDVMKSWLLPPLHESAMLPAEQEALSGAKLLARKPCAAGMCTSADASRIVVFTDMGMHCLTYDSSCFPSSRNHHQQRATNVLVPPAAAHLNLKEVEVSCNTATLVTPLPDGLDAFKIAWKIDGVSPCVGEITKDGQLLVVSLRADASTTATLAVSAMLSTSWGRSGGQQQQFSGVLRVLSVATGTALVDIPTARLALYLQFGCGGDLIGIGERHRIAVYRLASPPPSLQEGKDGGSTTNAEKKKELAELIHERSAPAVELGLTNFILSPAVDAYIFSFGKLALRSSRLYGEQSSGGKELTDAGGGAVYGCDGDTLFLAPTSGLLEGFDINAFRQPPAVDAFGVQSSLQLMPIASSGEQESGQRNDVVSIRCGAVSEPRGRYVVTASLEEMCVWVASTFRLARRIVPPVGSAATTVDAAESSSGQLSILVYSQRDSQYTVYTNALADSSPFNRSVTVRSPSLLGAVMCTTDGAYVLQWDASSAIMTQQQQQQEPVTISSTTGPSGMFPSSIEIVTMLEKNGGSAKEDAADITAVAIGGRRPADLNAVSQLSPLVVVLGCGFELRMFAWYGQRDAMSFTELRRLRFEVPLCRDTCGTIRRVALSSSSNLVLVGGFGRCLVLSYDFGADVPEQGLRHLADEALRGVWTSVADLGHESRAIPGFDLLHDKRSFSAMRVIFTPDSRWDVEPPRVFSSDRLISAAGVPDVLIQPPRPVSGSAVMSQLAGDAAFVATDNDLFSSLLAPSVPSLAMHCELRSLGNMLDLVEREAARSTAAQQSLPQGVTSDPTEQLPNEPQRPSAEAMDAAMSMTMSNEERPSMQHQGSAAGFSDTVVPLMTRLRHALLVVSPLGICSVPLGVAVAASSLVGPSLVEGMTGVTSIAPFPFGPVRRLKAFPAAHGEFAVVVLLARHHTSATTTCHVARIHDDSATCRISDVVQVEGLSLHHADDGNTAARASAERVFLRTSLACSQDGKVLLAITAHYTTHRTAPVRMFSTMTGQEIVQECGTESDAAAVAFPPVQELPPGAAERVDGFPSGGLEANWDGSVACRLYDSHNFGIFTATTAAACARRRSIIQLRTVGKTGEQEWWLAAKCFRFAPIARSSVACAIDGRSFALCDAEAQLMLAAVDLPESVPRGDDDDAAADHSIASVSFLAPGDGRSEPTVPAAIAVSFRDSSVHVAFYDQGSLVWTLHVSPQQLRGSTSRRMSQSGIGLRVTISLIMLVPSTRRIVQEAGTAQEGMEDQPGLVVVTAGRDLLVFPCCPVIRDAADTADPVFFDKCSPNDFVRQVMYRRV